MKFKKLNIIFKNTKIQNKNILVVYEYRGYLIAKFRFYTSKLYYNFGQNQYGGFKETWGIFDKETHEIYTQKKKRKICKDIIDNLFEIGKDFKNLDSKDFYQFIQMRD